MKQFLMFQVVVLFFVFLAAAAGSSQNKKGNPKVLIQTSMGDIELELNRVKAPVSVGNFLEYVNSGFYTNTVFHRVIKGFMIQGGGFDKDLVQKSTQAQIKNEAGNGLLNKRGTIAYARTNVVNSATSQFFINHKDNAFLDHRDESDAGFGYAVFGKVIKGMDVVDKIAETPTGVQKGMGDVPLQPVVILSVKVL
jgi:peptidyl-prolyl cis-trans isomerase A (cyclophilin A)